MYTITVVGLGAGAWDDLPMGSLRALESGARVVLRTERHPVVERILERGIRFETFDALYEEAESFESLYPQMADQLCAWAREGDVVYAVPGHPGIAERSVQELQSKVRGQAVRLQIGSGHSFIDDVLAKAGVDPVEGVLILDALSLEARHCHPSSAMLLMQVYSRDVASDVKLTLMEHLADEHPVTVVRAAGIPGEERVETVALLELDRLEWIDHLTSVFVPAPMEPDRRNRQLWRLLEVVEQLRSPGGCPWDQEQTHATLRPYVIEEAYEAAAEIDAGDDLALCAELGDLLLQVALHAQIGREDGWFNFNDCIGAITDKLIRRHPHVFGAATAQDAADAVSNWEQAKREEQAAGAPKESLAEPSHSLLDPVKRGVPAAAEALELQKVAAKHGFDWGTAKEVLPKLAEEARELLEADSAPARKQELGDLLFTVINLARKLDIDPEAALASTNTKFRNRFRYIEQRLAQRGTVPSATPLATLDELWNEAKQNAAGETKNSGRND